MAKQKRSPKYPFIPLEKALDRARQFYEAEGQNSASVPVAMQDWGYSPKSSGGLQTIGALVGYGLLEDQGSGSERRLKLSELALRILLDKRPDSKERDQHKRDAFLSPKIFRELWEEWGPGALPSEANMHHMLVFERNFRDKSVHDFLKVFTSNIDYCKMSSGEDVEDFNLGGQSNEQREDFESPAIESSVIEPPAVGKSMKQDTLDLDEGVTLLQWPANISLASFGELRDWMDFQLKRIESRAKKAETFPDDEKEE